MSLSPWTNWLTQSLDQLYQPFSASGESQFDSRFSSIFPADAVINVNHEPVSVSTFEKSIKDELDFTLLTGIKLDWKETFEVPDKNGVGGIVAGFFVEIRTLKIKIRAAPAENLGYRFFSAKVVKDEKVQPDSEGNQWRISEFFLTETNKAAPIHL